MDNGDYDKARLLWKDVLKDNASENDWYGSILSIFEVLPEVFCIHFEYNEICVCATSSAQTCSYKRKLLEANYAIIIWKNNYIGIFLWAKENKFAFHQFTEDMKEYTRSQCVNSSSEEIIAIDQDNDEFLENTIKYEEQRLQL